MNLRKIADIAKDLQTDDFHKEVLQDIRQFTYKNQKHYYPHFNGDMHDLIMEFYEGFTIPKKRRNGEVFSEMDRYDPEKLGGSDWTGTDSKKLAAYIQRYVVNRLIDKERTDKHEVNYDENYDENSGKSSLDFIANLAEKRDPRLEELVITPDMVFKARDVYDEMPDQNKFEFIKLFNKLKSDLPDNMLKFFSDLIGNDTAEQFNPNKVKSAPYLEEVRSVIGENNEVSEYKLQGKPALRITFSSVEEAKSADSAKVDEILSKHGYTPYVKKGRGWYYFKQQ